MGPLGLLEWFWFGGSPHLGPTRVLRVTRAVYSIINWLCTTNIRISSRAGCAHPLIHSYN